MHANGSSPRVFSPMNSIGTHTPQQYGFSLATRSKRPVEFWRRRLRIVTRSASAGRPSTTLLPLGHALTLQDKRAEAAQIYARALDLSPPSALRSAILNQLDVWGSPIGDARPQA